MVTPPPDDPCAPDPLDEGRQRLARRWAGALRQGRDAVEEADLLQRMHMDSSADAAGKVIPLRRPPIRQATVVRSGAAHTFDVFVRTIGTWWPVRPFSLGQDRVADVTFEPHLGGRVYETWDDGSTVSWGHVLDWNPPRGFTISWEILAAVTEVELTFRPLGPALTRVELEHRGWERLSEADLASATSVHGGYDRGWVQVLDAFRAVAEA
jgi:hypothetical protein